MTRAVVLGGGGVAGIAWETGILHGLLEYGVPIGQADAVIGTSAGSFAGSYLAGNSVPAWFVAQGNDGDEIAAPWAEDWLDDVEAAVKAGAGDPAASCRALGAMALQREVTSTAERMRVVRSRVDGTAWPAGPLRVAAIDADAGELHVIDRESGIDFLDAVAASGAVPGVWPVVEAGGRQWIDGACVSANNAQLAQGSDVVVIIALRPDGLVPDLPGLDDEVEALRASGARVEVILPDAESTKVLGANPFDPAVRSAASRAGYRQGQSRGGAIATAWDSSAG